MRIGAGHARQSSTGWDAPGHASNESSRIFKGISVELAASTRDQAGLIQDETQLVRLELGWTSYEDLVAALADDSHVRLTYDGETLEIMSPGYRHEKIARFIAAIVVYVLDAWDIDYEDAGSTTFRRKPDGGFEGDASFYTANAEKIRGMSEIDLAFHPAPDLILEVARIFVTDPDEIFVAADWRLNHDRDKWSCHSFALEEFAANAQRRLLRAWRSSSISGCDPIAVATPGDGPTIRRLAASSSLRGRGLLRSLSEMIATCGVRGVPCRLAPVGSNIACRWISDGWQSKPSRATSAPP
jgi:hypothetical protein